MLKAAAVLLLLQPLQAAEGAPSRPNILFILSDDMGYGDIGCFGGRFAPTPNLDRLAQEGIRFTQYYSVSPICSPSRAACRKRRWPGATPSRNWRHRRGRALTAA